ncbi:MAG: hypothetical protein Q7R64_03315 [bacterium]|nr:hypothetical protein [bacterium]
MKMRVITSVLSSENPLEKAYVMVLIPDMKIAISAKTWEPNILSVQPLTQITGRRTPYQYSLFCANHGDHSHEVAVPDKISEFMRELLGHIEPIYQWIIDLRQKERWK